MWEAAHPCPPSRACDLLPGEGLELRLGVGMDSLGFYEEMLGSAIQDEARDEPTCCLIANCEKLVSRHGVWACAPPDC